MSGSAIVCPLKSCSLLVSLDASAFFVISAMRSLRGIKVLGSSIEISIEGNNKNRASDNTVKKFEFPDDPVSISDIAAH